MQFPLEVGVLTGPVTVGFVEKPDMVWLSLDDPREALMDKLESAKLSKLEKVEVGCVAATVFSEDGALYRVVVLSTSVTEVEVRYCDYGNVEKKGMGELLKLPEDLAKQKLLAVQVRVDGVKGVADSSKNRARVEKKLYVEGLMVKVEEDVDGLVGMFEVEGKKIKFSKNKDSAPVEAKKVDVKHLKTDLSESNVEKKTENPDLNSVPVVSIVDGLKAETSQEKCKDDKIDENPDLNFVPVSIVDGLKAETSQEKCKDDKEDNANNVKSSQEKPSIEVKKVTAEVSKVEVQTSVDVVVSEASSGKGDEKVAAVKVPVSSGKLVMFNQLPNLKLLEGVEISGTVVYVSPLGGVWFCPQWIQASLDGLTVQVDALHAEKKLENLTSKLREGLLCIARSSQDGELYRARVVSVDKKITVNFIDFGNTDVVSVDAVYELPPGLEMLAPASAEVVLARDLPKQRTQEVLEETLMEVEDLVLVLEKEQTGARVGKFYDDGKEIKWDHMVETKKVFEKDRVDVENNEDENEEDVVIESEKVVKEAETKCPEKNLQVVVKSTVVPVPPIPKLVASLPKLIRMVPVIPLELNVEIPVFIVHVESVRRIWVCRESDEVRVSLLMDKLARIGEELKPAQRMKKGAVYGARFSQDGEMYRGVLKEVEDVRVVQFIDFGNMETKEEKELYDIPDEVGSAPAAAVAVDIKNDMEETEDNRTVVEDLLEGDNVTVAVMEEGVVFKVSGHDVMFNQVISLNTSSLVTTSEDMVTMEDVNTSKITLEAQITIPTPEVHLPSVPAEFISNEVPSQTKTNPTPAAFKSSRPAAPVLSSSGQSSKAPKVATSTPLPTVQLKATVPIPPSSTPQPVPTRNFAKAISALQSQLQVRPSASTGKKEPQVKTKQTKETPVTPACQWAAGDQVVARWPDGMWRQATVLKVNTSTGQAKVVSEGVEEAIVSLNNVRPRSLPVEALNLIDQGLVGNAIVRQKGDGASNEKKGVAPAVVGKVKDWMDKNMAQLKLGGVSSTDLEVEDPMSPPLEATSKQSLEQIPLPPSQDLAGYSRTSKGSLHLQSILNSANPELSSRVLTSLLTSSPGPLTLMTSPKSSYVIQKLVTVLPSAQLQPLLSIILSYFTQLSMDSSGCRVVQSLLEFSSPDQQRSITSLLCNTKTLVALAADRHGTYVAQACLPHLTPSTTALLALVNSLLGYTFMLGQHQCGTFFLQRLVGVLSTHYPGSGAACLLQEDILASLSQLATTEPGSRLVQAMLKDTQPNTLVRVARWMEENLKGVIVTKPAVYVAIGVVEQIVDRLGEEGSWTSLLDRLVQTFLGQDQDSSRKQNILITASLHPVGHLLAREVVSKVNFMGENTKTDVMIVLASEVDRLSADKFGGIVLKGLAESVI